MREIYYEKIEGNLSKIMDHLAMYIISDFCLDEVVELSQAFKENPYESHVVDRTNYPERKSLSIQTVRCCCTNKYILEIRVSIVD